MGYAQRRGERRAADYRLNLALTLIEEPLHIPSTR